MYASKGGKGRKARPKGTRRPYGSWTSLLSADSCVAEQGERRSCQPLMLIVGRIGQRGRSRTAPSTGRAVKEEAKRGSLSTLGWSGRHQVPVLALLREDPVISHPKSLNMPA